MSVQRRWTGSVWEDIGAAVHQVAAFIFATSGGAVYSIPLVSSSTAIPFVLSNGTTSNITVVAI